MVKGLRALSLFRYLTLVMALTFLTIASATYLRNSSNTGLSEPLHGNMLPYETVSQIRFLASQPYHVSFTASDENFEGVLTIKSINGDFSLEKEFKHSVSVDLRPVRGFYMLNITSLCANDVGFVLNIGWDGMVLEEDVIVSSIWVSFGFMLVFVLLDVVVRTFEGTGAR
ncbi:MAG: hypothetical protein ACP5PQ_05685 [Thermoproteota archaeon]